MASIEAIMVTLIPTLDISLYVAITLKAVIQNKPLSLEFTVSLLMILKPMILSNFVYLLILVCSQLKLYIILIYLVKVNLLIYSILILFS